MWHILFSSRIAALQHRHDMPPNHPITNFRALLRVRAKNPLMRRKFRLKVGLPICAKLAGTGGLGLKPVRSDEVISHLASGKIWTVCPYYCKMHAYSDCAIYMVVMP